MLEESLRGIIFRVYKKHLNPFRFEKSEFHGQAYIFSYHPS